MHDIDIDPSLLRSFVAVAEEGGFTSAGHRLGCTQSAVSIKIQKLEALLGQRLFERTSRSLALSAQGETLMPFARRLLSLNEETVKQMRAPDIQGRLRLGIIDYLAPDRLPVLLAELAQKYPRVRFEIRLGLSRDLLAALDEGDLDIAIAKPDHPDRKRIFAMTEQLFWVTAEGKTLDPAASLPLILLPAPCAYRAAAVDSIAKTGRNWYESMISTSIRGVQAAVKAGLGWSVLGASSLAPGIEVLNEADGFPALPALDIAIIGGTEQQIRILQPVVKCLSDNN